MIGYALDDKREVMSEGYNKEEMKQNGERDSECEKKKS